MDTIIKMLKAGVVDPKWKFDCQEALINAIKYNDIEIVTILLEEKRVDPSDNYNYAIRKASEYGRDKVVKLLLEDERVDPSDNYNYAIRYASNNGHDKVVKLLLEDKRVVWNVT
ncbi:ankyrin repeat domain-containing protein [bacterium]|nr:ankyrin repeat domain-containing protein [bacterium]